jgi:hypothetical protein
VHATTFADSWSWGRLVVVALWGVAGMVLALRFFTWEPRQPRAARAGTN